MKFVIAPAADQAVVSVKPLPDGVQLAINNLVVANLINGQGLVVDGTNLHTLGVTYKFVPGPTA